MQIKIRFPNHRHSFDFLFVNKMNYYDFEKFISLRFTVRLSGQFAVTHLPRWKGEL